MHALLTKETTQDEEEEDKIADCSIVDLHQYPEAEVFPNFDYGDNLYEIPLPIPGDWNEVQGELQQSTGEWCNISTDTDWPSGPGGTNTEGTPYRV